MTRPDRRALTADYKQTPRKAGLYAIRCCKSETIWVGTSLDLEKAANRHWFTLRMNNHRCPSLQSAWNAHGPDCFDVEIIETLADDLSAMARDSLLKEKRGEWEMKPGTVLL
jgi:predicted GIY-YIG superfamily endonuclease